MCDAFAYHVFRKINLIDFFSPLADRASSVWITESCMLSLELTSFEPRISVHLPPSPCIRHGTTLFRGYLSLQISSKTLRRFYTKFPTREDSLKPSVSSCSVFKRTNPARRWNFHEWGVRMGTRCAIPCADTSARRNLYREFHEWAERVARTLHTRWALEVEAVMQFAYGYGGAASPLVQKHLAASPYFALLELFRSHYLFSPFNASRRLSPAHSRLVVWLATGISY